MFHEIITKDDIRRNSINYYIDRILFLKGRIKITNLDYLKDNYTRTIAYYEKKIASLVEELGK